MRRYRKREQAESPPDRPPFPTCASHRPAQSPQPPTQTDPAIWPASSWPSNPAMQSMPLLFRQSLRHAVTLSRPSAAAVRSPLLSAVAPKALPVGNTLPRRSFSVCLQCRFRTQSGLHSSHESDRPKNEKPQDQSVNAELAQAVREGILKTTEADAGSSTSSQTSPSASEYTITQKPERAEPGNKKDGSTQSSSERDGSLPSYLENRRSQFAKQFGTMMDNLQSNVFVAGQRLNDLTGYSSIEALKNEIHTQGMQALAAICCEKPAF